MHSDACLRDHMGGRERERERAVPVFLLSADIFTIMRGRERGETDSGETVDSRHSTIICRGE